MNAWFRRIVRRPDPRNAVSSPSLRPVEPLKPRVGCTEYPPGVHGGSEGLSGAVERAKSRFETWLRSRDPSDPAQAGAAAVWAELTALRAERARHADIVREGGRHAQG